MVRVFFYLCIMPFPSAIENLETAMNGMTIAKIANPIFNDGTLQAQMIDLNRRQMYEFGVDSKGITLGEYAPATINYWKPRAASEGRDGKVDHVTLKDTGEFYDSIKIKNENAIIFEADMKKPGTDLEIIYPDALGLNDESKNEIFPEIQERFVETFLGLINE